MDELKKVLHESIERIKFSFKDDIESIDLDSIYIKYLGKNGEINKLIRQIREEAKEDGTELLREINRIKSNITEDIQVAKERAKDEELSKETVDLTIPVKPTSLGSLHPVSLVTEQLYQFFHYYGFSVFEGPEIEDDEHNFEMLGVGKDHPARDLQDTFYLLQPDKLLRTQTSSIESRQLKEQKPPIRFVSAGKAFRNETANKSNTSYFDQFQGVYVDKNVDLGHLKWMFTKSLKFVLGEDTEIRFRSKFYPEVEPGMSPDIKCKFCDGVGCEICKYRGWIEIAGGGMIHSKTLEMADIDSNVYSGFAFGWGLDRIVMSKYGIRDMRLLFNGSIVYQ